METFYIPNTKDRENEIKTNDINHGKLRITVGNKHHFPGEDCEIKVVINNSEFISKYRLNSGVKQKSHSIGIGKKAMDLLNIQEGDSVKVTKMADYEFVLEKAETLPANRTNDQEELLRKFSPK